MNEQGANTGGTGTPSVRRPEGPRRRFRAGSIVSVPIGTGRRRALAVVLTAALGFGGAAAIDQFALAAPPVPTASDRGPAGDGLTRLVVTPAAGAVTDADLAALQAASGVVTVQRVFDGSALVATRGLAPADLADIVADADVQVSPTATFSGSTVPDPLWSSYGYNLANTGANALNQTAVAGADVDAPTGWRAGTGRERVLAITDSGMDTSHPDLQGALWTNPNCGTDADRDGLVGDCHGWNFYTPGPDVVNAGGNDHGTGVAGIAGARAGNGEGSAGVAPDVQIMPLVVGYGRNVDMTAAAQAIHYAVDHGADVINASWGGPGISPQLTAAIDYANAHGVLIVAAAGNDGVDIETTKTYPASSTSPAVLTVGSSTAADTVSSFSNYGRTSVDLFAPGSAIVSPAPGGGYVAMSGTSMAAPEVAAAVALYRAHYPDASLAQLRQQLLDDTQPVAAFRGRSVSGGRLSLTALGNTATEVRYGFTSMVADPGTVTPQIVATGALPAGDYSVRLGLGEEYDGTVYALSGQSLTLNGVSATTDASGEVTFPLGARAAAAPLVLSPTTVLESARYVLTVQLDQGGAPVGLRFAAPLLVGQPAAAPTPTAPAPTTAKPAAPTTAKPAAPTTAGPAPSTRRASTTAAPAPTAPPAGASAAPTATGVPPTASPTTTTRAGSTSSPAASTATSSSTRASSSASSSATPTSPVRATTTSPATGAPTRSASPTSTGSAGSRAAQTSPSADPSPTPGPGGTIGYPAVGAFGLTSISPSRVTVAGGTRVTITGTAIPANAVVRIGSSSQAVVNTVSPTRLVFTTPALVAGVYDVTVSLPGGTTSSVLTGGLTYLAQGGTPSTSASAPSSSPATSSSATSPPAEATWRTGPHGQRLVGSDLFRSLAPAIWKVTCASACSGIAV